MKTLVSVVFLHPARSTGFVPATVVCLLLLLQVCRANSSQELPRPQLNGAHFRITTIADNIGFVNADENDDGTIAWSGYFIEILRAIARSDRANFTFDLLRPSGYGSLCIPVANETEPPYQPAYHKQFNCGQSDVTDLPMTNYTTDFYFGMYYIMAHRQLVNQFSMAFSPPTTGRNVMFGTATQLRDIQHLVEEQKAGIRKPACMFLGLADTRFIQSAFPEIQIREVTGIEPLQEGTCDVFITTYPAATSIIKIFFKRGECHFNGKPIGVIGEPLTFGPTHYGIGIRSDIPVDAVSAINYWLNDLMTCAPSDTNSCLNLDAVYAETVGTGEECGYVGWPSEMSALSAGAIIGIVLGAVVLVIIIYSVIIVYKLRQQRHRIRKRFVQQIARNIAIGPSPGSIPAHKLAEQVQHIGDSNGSILKEDLRNWIHDVKLTFISEKDFDALWAAMDVDGSGKVDAVEFFVFLSSCGPEFEEVYTEEQKMSKMERLKLAARRLSVINAGGEEGVRRIEHNLERNSRRNISLSSSLRWSSTREMEEGSERE